jgi:serine/threonine protein kinase
MSSPSASDGPATPGTLLAPGYRVIAHLSRGRRLDVYDAWSIARESRCVLKTLRPDRAQELAARRALLREGALLRRLTHPHLVRAYELSSAVPDGRPLVVLETLGGETLSHLVHRLDRAGRRMPVPDVAMLGLQLVSAVGYLHRQGWLHLDLKPSNIVVEAARAKVIDLSIARRPGRAKAGSGTFDYLAPEQARGGVLTAAADVWGVGVVLFDALAGVPPFGYGPEGESDTTSSATAPAGLRYPQLEGRAPRITTLRRRLPAPLAGAIDACLEPVPGDRPSLRELKDALTRWVRDGSNPTGQAA